MISNYNINSGSLRRVFVLIFFKAMLSASAFGLADNTYLGLDYFDSDIKKILPNNFYNLQFIKYISACFDFHDELFIK